MGNPLKYTDPKGLAIAVFCFVPGVGWAVCGAAVDAAVAACAAVGTAATGLILGGLFAEAAQEEYDSLEACVGCVNPLDEVEYEGKTKDPGLREQGYTEKHTGIDSNGTYQSGFRNPTTGKWTGGHESSKNNKYW